MVVFQDQSSEDKLNPVIGTVSDSSPGSGAVEGVPKTVHQPSVWVSSSPSPALHSALPASQPGPETLPAKRPGRKAASRVEGPRRRGRKPGVVSHAVDASVGQDSLVSMRTHLF